jgi:general stress protein 26
MRNERGAVLPAAQTPVTELDPRFSGADATALPWSAASDLLETAELFWISTVRPDGRPHVTTLLAVWMEGALYFATGRAERKAKNLAENANVVLTTGCNTFAGLDVAVEGEAIRQTDQAKLERVAAQYVAKYGEEWRFYVRDGAFYHGAAALVDDPGAAYVFEVTPKTVFGFGKGEPFSQTRWRF